jgi:hypothetical protein
LARDREVLEGDGSERGSEEGSERVARVGVVAESKV